MTKSQRFMLAHAAARVRAITETYRAAFAAALRASYRSAPTLAEIADEIARLPEVCSAKVWDARRVYVNIAGADRAKAGDRNAKVYFDARSGGWHIDGLKGCMSAAFARNLRAFAEPRCPRAFTA